MKNTNKPAKITAGLLSAACLTGAVSASVMADSYVWFDEYGMTPKPIALNQKVTGEEGVYYEFTPEKTGAYMIDIEDNSKEDNYPIVNSKDDYGHDFLIEGDDVYAVFEKGTTYMISNNREPKIDYTIEIKESDFGATSTDDYQYVTPGGQVTFKTSVISPENVTYSWIDPDGNEVGTDSTYTFKAYTHNDNGYICNIDLGNGHSADFAFFAEVDPGYEVAVYRRGDMYDSYVDPNQKFELEVVTTGSYNGEFKYQWYKNDVEIKGATSKVLETSTDKAAVYSCKVTDKFGNEITGAFNIFINNGNNGFFSAFAEPVEVKPGEDATFKLQIEAEDKTGIKIEWYDDAGKVIGTSSSFTVKNVQRTTLVHYKVSDKFGNVCEGDAAATIDNGLYVRSVQPYPYYIGNSKSVTLNVEVSAKEKDGMTLLWSAFKDGEPIALTNNTSDSITINDITGNISVECSVYDKYGNFGYGFFDVQVGEDPEKDLRDFVTRCYNNFLNRDAGRDGGIDYWMDCLKTYTMTGADVARGFISSPEFTEAGYSDEKFLEIMYSTIFNRESEAEGKAYWSSQLASGAMDRMTVANCFLDSQEWADVCAKYGIRSGSSFEKSGKDVAASDATNSFVERMYTTALARESDPNGKAYWANELANIRVSGEQVALAFFLSDELTNANISNEEFVLRLYKTFMDREPEAEGKFYWENALRNGDVSREETVLAFSRSGEFVTLCTDAKIAPYFA